MKPFDGSKRSLLKMKENASQLIEMVSEQAVKSLTNAEKINLIKHGLKIGFNDENASEANWPGFKIESSIYPGGSSHIMISNDLVSRYAGSGNLKYKKKLLEDGEEVDTFFVECRIKMKDREAAKKHAAAIQEVGMKILTMNSEITRALSFLLMLSI